MKNFLLDKTECIIYADGASSGNPGPSGIGAVIKTSVEKITISSYIGITTNNVAEYTAVLKSVGLAKNMGIKKVNIMLDSELVVRQLLGIYKVKQKKLLSLYEKIKKILTCFEEYKIYHIPREENTEADRLSKEGIKLIQS